MLTRSTVRHRTTSHPNRDSRGKRALGSDLLPRRQNNRIRKITLTNSPPPLLFLTHTSHTTQIKSRGPLRAIIISHPHYYTTHLVWARAFHVPIYTSAEDASWFDRADDSTSPCRRLIKTNTEVVLPEVTAIKTGGHFPGSLVLHWDKHLLIADTFVTVPVSGIFSSPGFPKNHITTHPHTHSLCSSN